MMIKGSEKHSSPVDSASSTFSDTGLVFFFFLASFWPMQRHAVLLFHCNELLKKFPACGLDKSQMFSLHNKSSTITATSIKFINAIQTKMSHQI